MAGNVEEWVADWYGEDYYSSSPYENPQGPTAGSFRVLRGGSEGNDGPDLRVAYRNRFLPHLAKGVFGFRCAASPE
jgi:formylglycine-generating enzyme required for sulfatase activity